MTTDSRTLDKLLLQGKAMSDFLTWFSVGAPILTGIFNPVLLDILYRQQKTPDRERKILVRQEIGKQIINVSTVLAFFALTVVALPPLLRKYATPRLLDSKKGERGKADLTSLVTNVLGFMALTFLSPVLTPPLLKAWEQRTETSQPKPCKPTSPSLSHSGPLPAAPKPLTTAYFGSRGVMARL